MAVGEISPRITAWTRSLAAMSDRIGRVRRARLSEVEVESRLPRPFVEANATDDGVYRKQVFPLVDDWRSWGGAGVPDIRPVGGHPNDDASRSLLLDATAALTVGPHPNAGSYQSNPSYAAHLTKDPLIDLARRAVRLRSRLRALAHRPSTGRL